MISRISSNPCCETIGPIAKRKNKDPSKTAEDGVFQLSLSVERWRFYAYLGFWTVCMFAMFMNKFFVKPALLAGPPDGNTCPPFSRNNPELGVFPGKGFDQDTQSHLVEVIKFNNICVNWDYSPSRELTAMIYPLYEYSLLIYTILKFAENYLAYLRGELTEWFWTLVKIMFPISLFFITQFRMIFVYIAYVNIQEHTMAFLGLQFALYWTTLSNCLAVFHLEIGYSIFGFKGSFKQRAHRTNVFAATYLIITTIVSAWIFYTTAMIAFYKETVPWNVKESFIPGVDNLHCVDALYMICNAILPLHLAREQAKANYPLKFTVEQRVDYANDDPEDDEN